MPTRMGEREREREILSPIPGIHLAPRGIGGVGCLQFRCITLPRPIVQAAWVHAENLPGERKAQESHAKCGFRQG